MRNAFIWFIEAKCVAGKVKPPKKMVNVVTLNICYFHIFKIFMKASEEMRQKL